MKKIFLLIILAFSQITFAQEDQLLKDLADSACKCIDSISTYNKITDSINSQVSKCISKNAMAYQLGEKIKKVDTTKTSSTIEINTNENSDEFKKYYYKMERFLTDNCKVLKLKLSMNDIVKKYSFSDNELAIEYYEKAGDASKMGNYEEAVKFYKMAIKEDDKFVFAYDNLGYAYRKLERFDDAIEAYKKSLNIDPEGLMPLQSIAIAYKYKKEFDKAINAYEKITQIDPKNPEAFYGIGLIQFINKEDYESALDNICQAYILYIEQKSAYRTDAEKLISMIYQKLKEQNKLDFFNKTLAKYHISQY